MEERRRGPLYRLLQRVSQTKLAGHTILELERLMNTLDLSETDVLRFFVESRNSSNKDRFSTISFDKRVLLLPQCLRSRECPAKLGVYGYICERCGKCIIQDIIDEGSRLGYRIFILPGGTMVEKILKEVKPDACIGVACLKELFLGVLVSQANNITSMAIPLLREGCVDTEVDWNEVKGMIRLTKKN